MKTNVSNSDRKHSNEVKNEGREEITLTVFAVFFLITFGLLMLSQL